MMTVTRNAVRALRQRPMEEVHIIHALLRDEPNGVMVDVGAHHGHTLLPFARDGWRVFAFEPDPVNRSCLERSVEGFNNVTVIPDAVSDVRGRATIYASDQSTGISSLSPFTEMHEARASVDVITLRDYISDAGIADVTFLKIDVEGFEQRVLNGFPWSRIQPKVVVAEFEDAKTHPLGYDWNDLARSLTEHGYEVLVSEWHPIVAYGAQHTWRRFARYPTALRDPDAWGNLIGVRPALMSALEHRASRYGLRHRLSRLTGRGLKLLGH
jgi:FkbM family methyltransferase